MRRGRGLMEHICCSLKKGHQRIVGSHRGMRFVESLLLYRGDRRGVGEVKGLPAVAMVEELPFTDRRDVPKAVEPLAP